MIIATFSKSGAIFHLTINIFFLKVHKYFRRFYMFLADIDINRLDNGSQILFGQHHILTKIDIYFNLPPPPLIGPQIT